MFIRPLLVLGLGSAAALFAASAAAEGSNELWKVTATMHMQKPMEMTMPAFTSESCVPPGQAEKPPEMPNGECTLDHWEKDGARTEFQVSCNQQGVVMTGSGWTEKPDDKHYQGEMTFSGTAAGQPMKMTMNFSGVRIGNCPANKAE